MIKASRITIFISAVALFALSGLAEASYNRTPESSIDLDVFKIDEDTFLGTRINGDFMLTDETGSEFRLEDKFGKPLILVLSYFSCDGVCSAVNNDLKELLASVKRMNIGKNYNILTVSFDKYDTAETTKMFKDKLSLPEKTAKAWTFATLKEPENIKKLTDGIGFKYFWSPRDRVFYHPNIYVLVSPEGRVTRYLYASSIEGKDIELALIETGKGQIRPSEVINLVASYCYSYNYKEGRYTYNIPVFVAVGSLTIGVTSLIVSLIAFRRKKNKRGSIG
ncbi:MAG: SCO family protein [Nitrospinota bacterium]